MQKRRTSLPYAVQVIAVLAFAAASFFLFSVAYQVSTEGVRSVGAAYGWTGEKGTLTVTGDERKRRGNGRTAGRQCLATFTPADGRPPRTGVAAHVSDCEKGRTAQARFVPGDDGWFRSERDGVYDTSGAGAVGWIIAIIFVDLFCGLVGLASAVFAYGFGRELLSSRTGA